MMEPLGPDVRRELTRFGPQTQLADILAAWPPAVGEAIARNAWPARIARDGTLHVATRDAIWAFELGHRAGEIAAAIGVPAIRFAAGRLPDKLPVEATEATTRSAPLPSAEDELLAREIAAAIEDENLRALAARAVAAGLAARPDDRSI
jgi:hypothetical protein